jgi:hypothetical protein
LPDAVAAKLHEESKPGQFVVVNKNTELIADKKLLRARFLARGPNLFPQEQH